MRPGFAELGLRSNSPSVVSALRLQGGGSMRGGRIMDGLDWRVIEDARLCETPFAHIAVRQALTPACAAAIPTSYPDIRSPGSFNLRDAPPGPALAALIADLVSPRFTAAMERVFALDLRGRPAVVTLRGRSSSRDGRIHTDSTSKVLSLLLYLNTDWCSKEGQLRLFTSPADLQPTVEIPATLGSLVAFRRSENSWHGHSTYTGERRVLQLNYLRSKRESWIGDVRHRLSALGKPRVAA
jgi:SM-20-related protein